MPVASGSAQSREPLVALRDHGIAAEGYYARTDGHNPPYLRAIPGADPTPRARREVVERLKSVNELLRPQGVELFVLDAYRPLECQRSLWRHFVRQARKSLP